MKKIEGCVTMHFSEDLVFVLSFLTLSFPTHEEGKFDIFLVSMSLYFISIIYLCTIF